MKVYGNRKTALPFPLLYTLSGSERINASHGGAMPRIYPPGHEKAANGTLAVYPPDNSRVLQTYKLFLTLQIIKKIVPMDIIVWIGVIAVILAALNLLLTPRNKDEQDQDDAQK